MIQLVQQNSVPYHSQIQQTQTNLLLLGYQSQQEQVQDKLQQNKEESNNKNVNPLLFFLKQSDKLKIRDGMQKYFCVLYFLTILIAIASLIVYFLLISLPIDYDYVLLNWNQSPITKIYSSNDCSSKLLNYSFNGTFAGCNCDSAQGIYLSTNLQIGSCTEEQTSNGCIQINSIPAQVLNRWKDGTLSTLFCIERLTGFTYTESDCLSENKDKVICGDEEGDEFMLNALCLPIGFSCPLKTFSQQKSDTTFNQVGNNNFYTSNISPSTSSHLIDVLISQNDGICKEYKTKHYSQTIFTQYKLYIQNLNICFYDDLDPRFTVISFNSQNDFYNVNGLANQIKSLPQYPYDANINYFMYQQRYIPWKQLGACKTTHMPYFIDLKNSLQSFDQLWLSALIFNWINLLVFSIIIYEILQAEEWKMYNYIKIIYLFVFLIQIILITTIFIIAMINNNKNNNMNIDQCSEVLTNQLISSLQDQYYSNNCAYAIFLFLLILLKFIQLINTMYYYRSQCYKYYAKYKNHGFLKVYSNEKSHQFIINDLDKTYSSLIRSERINNYHRSNSIQGQLIVEDSSFLREIYTTRLENEREYQKQQAKKDKNFKLDPQIEGRGTNLYSMNNQITIEQIKYFQEKYSYKNKPQMKKEVQSNQVEHYHTRLLSNEEYFWSRIQQNKLIKFKRHNSIDQLKNRTQLFNPQFQYLEQKLWYAYKNNKKQSNKMYFKENQYKSNYDMSIYQGSYSLQHIIQNEKKNNKRFFQTIHHKDDDYNQINSDIIIPFQNDEESQIKPVLNKGQDQSQYPFDKQMNFQKSNFQQTNLKNDEFQLKKQNTLLHQNSQQGKNLNILEHQDQSLGNNNNLQNDPQQIEKNTLLNISQQFQENFEIEKQYPLDNKNRNTNQQQQNSNLEKQNEQNNGSHNKVIELSLNSQNIQQVFENPLEKNSEQKWNKQQNPNLCDIDYSSKQQNQRQQQIKPLNKSKFLDQNNRINILNNPLNINLLNGTNQDSQNEPNFNNNISDLVLIAGNDNKLQNDHKQNGKDHIFSGSQSQLDNKKQNPIDNNKDLQNQYQTDINPEKQKQQKIGNDNKNNEPTLINPYNQLEKQISQNPLQNSEYLQNKQQNPNLEDIKQPFDQQNQIQNQTRPEIDESQLTDQNKVNIQPKNDQDINTQNEINQDSQKQSNLNFLRNQDQIEGNNNNNLQNDPQLVRNDLKFNGSQSQSGNFYNKKQNSQENKQGGISNQQYLNTNSEKQKQQSIGYNKDNEISLNNPQNYLQYQISENPIEINNRQQQNKQQNPNLNDINQQSSQLNQGQHQIKPSNDGPQLKIQNNIDSQTINPITISSLNNTCQNFLKEPNINNTNDQNQSIISNNNLQKYPQQDIKDHKLNTSQSISENQDQQKLNPFEGIKGSYNSNQQDINPEKQIEYNSEKDNEIFEKQINNPDNQLIKSIIQNPQDNKSGQQVNNQPNQNQNDIEQQFNLQNQKQFMIQPNNDGQQQNNLNNANQLPQNHLNTQSLNNISLAQQKKSNLNNIGNQDQSLDTNNSLNKNPQLIGKDHLFNQSQSFSGNFYKQNQIPFDNKTTFSNQQQQNANPKKQDEFNNRNNKDTEPALNNPNNQFDKLLSKNPLENNSGQQQNKQQNSSLHDIDQPSEQQSQSQLQIIPQNYQSQLQNQNKGDIQSYYPQNINLENNSNQNSQKQPNLNDIQNQDQSLGNDNNLSNNPQLIGKGHKFNGSRSQSGNFQKEQQNPFNNKIDQQNQYQQNINPEKQNGQNNEKHNKDTEPSINNPNNQQEKQISRNPLENNSGQQQNILQNPNQYNINQPSDQQNQSQLEIRPQNDTSQLQNQNNGNLQPNNPQSLNDINDSNQNSQKQLNLNGYQDQSLGNNNNIQNNPEQNRNVNKFNESQSFTDKFYMEKQNPLDNKQLLTNQNQKNINPEKQNEKNNINHNKDIQSSLNNPYYLLEKQVPKNLQDNNIGELNKQNPNLNNINQQSDLQNQNEHQLSPENEEFQINNQNNIKSLSNNHPNINSQNGANQDSLKEQNLNKLGNQDQSLRNDNDLQNNTQLIGNDHKFNGPQSFSENLNKERQNNLDNNKGLQNQYQQNIIPEKINELNNIIINKEIEQSKNNPNNQLANSILLNPQDNKTGQLLNKFQNPQQTNNQEPFLQLNQNQFDIKSNNDGYQQNNLKNANPLLPNPFDINSLNKTNQGSQKQDQILGNNKDIQKDSQFNVRDNKFNGSQSFSENIDKGKQQPQDNKNGFRNQQQQNTNPEKQKEQINQNHNQESVLPLNNPNNQLDQKISVNSLENNNGQQQFKLQNLNLDGIVQPSNQQNQTQHQLRPSNDEFKLKNLNSGNQLPNNINTNSLNEDNQDSQKVLNLNNLGNQNKQKDSLLNQKDNKFNGSQSFSGNLYKGKQNTFDNKGIQNQFQQNLNSEKQNEQNNMNYNKYQEPSLNNPNSQLEKLISKNPLENNSGQQQNKQQDPNLYDIDQPSDQQNQSQLEIRPQNDRSQLQKQNNGNIQSNNPQNTNSLNDMNQNSQKQPNLKGYQDQSLGNNNNLQNDLKYNLKDQKLDGSQSQSRDFYQGKQFPIDNEQLLQNQNQKNINPVKQNEYNYESNNDNELSQNNPQNQLEKSIIQNTLNNNIGQLNQQQNENQNGTDYQYNPQDQNQYQIRPKNEGSQINNQNNTNPQHNNNPNINSQNENSLYTSKVPNYNNLGHQDQSIGNNNNQQIDNQFIGKDHKFNGSRSQSGNFYKEKQNLFDNKIGLQNQQQQNINPEKQNEYIYESIKDNELSRNNQNNQQEKLISKNPLENISGQQQFKQQNLNQNDTDQQYNPQDQNQHQTRPKNEGSQINNQNNINPQHNNNPNFNSQNGNILDCSQEPNFNNLGDQDQSVGNNNNQQIDNQLIGKGHKFNGSRSQSGNFYKEKQYPFDNKIDQQNQYQQNINLEKQNGQSKEKQNKVIDTSSLINHQLEKQTSQNNLHNNSIQLQNQQQKQNLDGIGQPSYQQNQNQQQIRPTNDESNLKNLNNGNQLPSIRNTNSQNENYQDSQKESNLNNLRNQDLGIQNLQKHTLLNQNDHKFNASQSFSGNFYKGKQNTFDNKKGIQNQFKQNLSPEKQNEQNNVRDNKNYEPSIDNSNNQLGKSSKNPPDNKSGQQIKQEQIKQQNKNLDQINQQKQDIDLLNSKEKSQLPYSFNNNEDITNQKYKLNPINKQDKDEMISPHSQPNNQDNTIVNHEKGNINNSSNRQFGNDQDDIKNDYNLSKNQINKNSNIQQQQPIQSQNNKDQYQQNPNLNQNNNLKNNKINPVNQLYQTQPDFIKRFIEKNENKQQNSQQVNKNQKYANFNLNKPLPIQNNNDHNQIYQPAQQLKNQLKQNEINQAQDYKNIESQPIKNQNLANKDSNQMISHQLLGDSIQDNLTNLQQNKADLINNKLYNQNNEEQLINLDSSDSEQELILQESESEDDDKNYQNNKNQQHIKTKNLNKDNMSKSSQNFKPSILPKTSDLHTKGSDKSNNKTDQMKDNNKEFIDEKIQSQPHNRQQRINLIGDKSNIDHLQERNDNMNPTIRQFDHNNSNLEKDKYIQNSNHKQVGRVQNDSKLFDKLPQNNANRMNEQTGYNVNGRKKEYQVDLSNNDEDQEDYQIINVISDHEDDYSNEDKSDGQDDDDNDNDSEEEEENDDNDNDLSIDGHIDQDKNKNRDTDGNISQQKSNIDGSIDQRIANDKSEIQKSSGEQEKGEIKKKKKKKKKKNLNPNKSKKIILKQMEENYDNGLLSLNNIQYLEQERKKHSQLKKNQGKLIFKANWIGSNNSLDYNNQKSQKSQLNLLQNKNNKKLAYRKQQSLNYQQSQQQNCLSLIKLEDPQSIQEKMSQVKDYLNSSTPKNIDKSQSNSNLDIRISPKIKPYQKQKIRYGWNSSIQTINEINEENQEQQQQLSQQQNNTKININSLSNISLFGFQDDIKNKNKITSRQQVEIKKYQRNKQRQVSLPPIYIINGNIMKNGK